MKKIAVVIGVSDYPQHIEAGTALSPLPKAIVDAKAIAQLLEDKDIGDFEVDLLINPSKSKMENAINDAFASSRAKQDMILLYFSGHGIEDISGDFISVAAKLTKWITAIFSYPVPYPLPTVTN